MKNFTVLDLLELDLKPPRNLDLKCLCGRKGLAREIPLPEINRPGLALSGFFELFVGQRMQVFGQGEFAYLQKLEAEGNFQYVEKFFAIHPPCCIFCHGLTPSERFQALSEEYGVSTLHTSLESSDFTVRLLQVLGDIFAPRKTLHGVFVEVHGTGVLITGESGVGKSETALELIGRGGNRLIADDAVLIKRLYGNMLMGYSTNPAMASHMEIRGMGIVNVAQVFGIGAVKENKQLEIVVDLEEWKAGKVYDRMGTKSDTVDILGVNVPSITIPIKPGRNIPIIIETAVLNERLKQRGYFAAREFNKDIIQWLESENARKLYFDNYG
ncbi:MAG: HPr(Ser) kinase/phosphatase [Spirochaetales bacterium]|nr:HPr(Ser) kinase/phosphatase [Spirochaetales bacterium]